MSKLRKKDLRNPDQVWQASASTYRLVKDQWLFVVIAVGILFVVAVGSIYFYQQQRLKEADAQHALGELASLYEQWQIEKQNQTEEELAQTRKEFEETFQELKQSFSNSDAAAYASLVRGNLLSAEDNTEQSLQALRDFYQGAPQSMKDFAAYRLAIALEQQQSWEESLRLYNEILDRPSSAVRKWALLGKARSQGALERHEEATRTYDQFLEEFPKLPELAKIRGLRALSAAAATK